MDSVDKAMRAIYQQDRADANSDYSSSSQWSSFVTCWAWGRIFYKLKIERGGWDKILPNRFASVSNEFASVMASESFECVVAARNT